jgi:adenosylmethionine-8-amino-7-oxononanoate aminotransferase
MTLIDRDKRYVWHPFTQAQIAPDPIPIVKGDGVWLYDEDGNKYLDSNSSWWTIIHGHGHPYLAEKLHKQFLTLDHTVFAGATHPAAVEAAEKVLKVLPNNFEKIFFSDNGSTSVEVGIKMVYQYWYNKGIERKRFLALEGAYHGDTFGAMSVGQRGYFNKPFEHLFFDVDYIPLPTEENIDQICEQMVKLFESGEFAGFIFEPLVQGAAGFRIYSPEHLDRMMEIARRYGVKIIADEVMTGFGRTGKTFAIQHLKNCPDIVCMSKGLTGGVMACGFTAATGEMYDSFLSDDLGKALLHGHSFTANPLSSAIVSASLDLLMAENTQKRIQQISKAHQCFVKEHQDNPIFRSVKSLGTILSCEVEIGEESGYFSDLRTKAYNYFLENEILNRPLGNVIFFNPPYCITDEELDDFYQKLMNFLNEQ